MLPPHPPSDHRLPDGRTVPWQGLYTGPRVLGAREVAALADRLIGMDCSSVPAAAAKELVPFHMLPGHRPPALLLHSTTGTLRAFEGEVADLAAGRSPHDVTTYTEARSVLLATADDLAVGRTAPWAEAVGIRGVPAVDLGDREHYYLSHALLVMAAEHDRGADTPLRRIIGWLRAHRDAVIRVYALDLEMQIFLLWLRRAADLPRLVTDANGPVIATRWNRKRHLHPCVDAAERLDPAGLSPEELLAAEQRLSEAHGHLGLRIPVLPGYLVAREHADRDAFTAGVLRAAELLRGRYGTTTAALKPSEAGDGARITGHLDLTDTGRLARVAREAHLLGDDYLLEAWVEFLPVELGGRSVPVAPSGHFRHGQVAEGITLQALNGYAWAGNTYVDEAGWTGLGLPEPVYRTIRGALESIRAAFLGEPSRLDGSHQALVTGGIDFAVGRLGGRFGERPAVGAIDFNLSSNGAECLRAFLDEARRRGVAEGYAATRVFRPTPWATLRRLEAVAAARLPAGGLAQAVACVPDRWGMIATTGTTPAEAAGRATELVDTLTTTGLAHTTTGLAHTTTPAHSPA
ncbi:hypothetical protein A6P39_028085 [Streptomyces sp. FXJ1.172]|uniref:hypothetical protein n=1 Tax=Streptomyces sp. FXJ1.172 TaxID=710705 RepID=UPI00083337DE|nr:hypothetical protein [Streptomyces sp. FXJ1.172]WEO97568.1 hypothetical protein A6P39_028085 [Streptomyces sp. FXJ1.172]